MARHTPWIFVAALVVTGPAWAESVCRTASDAWVQGDQNPAEAAEPQKSEPRRPWKFWTGDSRTELGITTQQAADIEQIFHSAMRKLEALKQKVDSLEASVSQTIKDGDADLAVVTQQVDRFEAARADLSKTRTLMLYLIRGVLTADQRTRLKAMMDRWEAADRRTRDRTGRR